MIDAIDKKILYIIQSDARTTNAEIARQVGLTPSATLERVRKLQESGVVAAYQTRLDPSRVGLGLLAFVFVRTDESKAPEPIARRLRELPEALEVHMVAGDDCYIVKLRAANTSELSRLLHERVKKIPGVVGTKTTIVLETFKETSVLPLDQVESGEGEGR